MNVNAATAATALLIGCQTVTLGSLTGTDPSRSVPVFDAGAIAMAPMPMQTQTAAAPQGDRGAPERTVSAGRR